MTIKWNRGISDLDLDPNISGRNPVMSVPIVATADLPATLSNGQIWYDSTLTALRARINGATSTLATAAGVNPVADDVYNNGAWAVTVDANDVAFTLGNAFNLIINANAAGATAVGLEINDNATGQFTDGILFTAANVITDAIDASAANIVNAINIGANVILGTTGSLSFTNYSITGAGVATVNTLIAANATITNLTLDAVDGFTLTGDCTFTTAATNGNGLLLDGSSLTTGNVLRIEADAVNLNGGMILACTVDAVNQLTVGENGAITITGTTGQNVLTLSAGDINVVGGTVDVTANAGADAIDIIPATAGAALDINLQAASNLATGYIDIDGSTGSGPVIAVNFTGGYTGGVLVADMTNAVGANALTLTGAGVRTVALVSITDTPSTVATFDLNVTPAGAAANANVFDIDVAGVGTASVIAVNFSAAYAGNALAIDMTNAVDSEAIVLTGAGARVDALISITDVMGLNAPTFDCDITPAGATATANLFDIDVAGVGTANIFDFAFAAAYAATNGIVYLNMTNAVGSTALSFLGAGARTVPLIAITDVMGVAAPSFDCNITPAAATATANLFDIDVAGVGTANILDFAFAANYAATNGAIYLNMTNALASTAISLVGAGVRTTGLVVITDTPSSVGTFDLNVTPAGATATANVLDIDVAGVGTADIIQIDFSAAYAGDGINITTTNMDAVGQALVIDGSHAATGDIVSFASSGALAGGTGRVCKISSAGNLGAATNGAGLWVEETGAAQATSYASYIASTNNEALLVDTGKSRFDEEVSFKQSNRNFVVPNFVNAGGVNNAITANLTDADGVNVPLANGLRVVVNLGALTLQAGANTFALNGGAALALVSHYNTANNIGTAYAANTYVELMYNGAGATFWMDVSQ